jgi:hypothetical protein
MMRRLLFWLSTSLAAIVLLQVALKIAHAPASASWRYFQHLVVVAVFSRLTWGTYLKQDLGLAKLRTQIDVKAAESLVVGSFLLTSFCYLMLLELLPSVRP